MWQVMAPSIPVTPIHASPAALADTSPMGAAAGLAYRWTNMAEHAQLQILIPSLGMCRGIESRLQKLSAKQRIPAN